MVALKGKGQSSALAALVLSQGHLQLLLVFLLSAILAVAQSIYISRELYDLSIWLAGVLFVILFATQFVVFEVFFTRVPSWISRPLALIATAALAFWSHGAVVPANTAMTSSAAGPVTVAASEVHAWGESVWAYYMHPHYGDQQTVEEITVAVPPGASRVRIAATKPEATVVSGNGAYLGDGVQVFAAPVSNGVTGQRKLVLTLTPQQVAQRGWSWAHLAVDREVQAFRISVTKGPEGSTVDYDATYVHVSFTGFGLVIARMARASTALLLGALLLIAVSIWVPTLDKAWPFSRYPNLTMWDWGTIVLLAVMLLLTVWLFYTGTTIFVWRHDSIYYLEHNDYLGKTRAEGRWLNLILFPILQSTPGPVAWLLGLLMFGGFAFACAFEVSGDRLFSGVVSLLFMQSVPLYLVGTWPATALPAYVVLGLAALTYRHLPLHIFYPLFGILSLATVSEYYYLLPLLHLGRFFGEAKDVLWRLLAVIIWWAVGFLAGFVVILFVEYLLFGQFGLAIGAWRAPNYVESAPDLYANVGSRLHYLGEDLRAVLQSPAVVTFMIFALAVRSRIATPAFIAAALTVCTAMILAHYVITIPVGIRIAMRTVIATFAGVLAFVFISQRLDAGRRMVVTICALGVFLQYWAINHDNLVWFRTVTTTYYQELLRASPLPPPLYRGLIVEELGARPIENRIREAERLHPRYMESLSVLFYSEMNGDWRWGAAAREAGFRNIIFCSGETDARCTEHMRSFTPEPCERQKGLYCVRGVTKDNYLVIRFNTAV